MELIRQYHFTLNSKADHRSRSILFEMLEKEEKRLTSVIATLKAYDPNDRFIKIFGKDLEDVQQAMCLAWPIDPNSN